MEERKFSGRRFGSGFTLIEVLVVVAIIALLIAILFPSLKEARELSWQVGCKANLRSIGQAMNFYSGDHEQNYFMYNIYFNFSPSVMAWRAVTGNPPNHPGTIGDDSAVALALDVRTYRPGGPSFLGGGKSSGATSKKYIRDWDLLICPATNNRVEKPEDLNINADSRRGGPASRSSGLFGHSYEFWNGFQKYDFAGPGSAPVSSAANAETRRYTGSELDRDSNGYADCLKRPKIVENRASYVILALDGDDPTDEAEDNNNFPDNPYDNHGPRGWNMLMADMHVDFVTQKQTYNALYRSDMDVSAVPPEYRPSDGKPPFLP